MSKIRSTSRWKRVRRKVLDRDKHRCRKCGIFTSRFEVDHVVPLEAGGAEYALDNLQTLCRPCHFAKTTLDRGGVPHVPDAAWERLKAEMGVVVSQFEVGG